MAQKLVADTAIAAPAAIFCARGQQLCRHSHPTPDSGAVNPATHPSSHVRQCQDGKGGRTQRRAARHDRLHVEGLRALPANGAARVFEHAGGPGSGAVLPLRADLTQLTPTNIALAEKFSIEAFPTIVFIGSDGKERLNLRLVGYENARFFTERLQQAR